MSRRRAALFAAFAMGTATVVACTRDAPVRAVTTDAGTAAAPSSAPVPPHSAPAPAAAAPIEVHSLGDKATDIAITCTPSTGAGPSVKASARTIQGLLRSAEAVRDPNDGFSYAPFCDGSLRVEGRTMDVALYLGGRGQLRAGSDVTHFSFDARPLSLALSLVPARHECNAPFSNAYVIAPGKSGADFVAAAGTAVSADEATRRKALCYAPGPHRGFNGERWCCSF